MLNCAVFTCVNKAEFEVYFEDGNVIGMCQKHAFEPNHLSNPEVTRIIPLVNEEDDVPAFAFVGRKRDAQQRRMTEEVQARVRDAAVRDTEMIFDWVKRYTDVQMQPHQIVIIYDHFYKLHQKEATN